MKKIFSIALVIALALTGGSVSAVAENLTSPGSADTTVSYAVAEPSYTVTIPATAELNKEFSITAEDVADIPSKQTLTVTVSDWTKAAEGDGFALTSGTTYIPCTVKQGAGGVDIALGSTVLAVASGETAGSSKLYITQADANGIYAPGTYKGTMTFTVAVKKEIVWTTVSTATELQRAIDSTVNDVNYIRLSGDMTAADVITQSVTDKPFVLDLDGYTLDAAAGITVEGTATITNGTVKGAGLTATNSTFTLTDLTLNATAANGVLASGTSVGMIENCTITTNFEEFYPININSANVQITATDVTLINTNANGKAYRNQTTYFILDGESATVGKYSTSTYKTPGRE